MAASVCSRLVIVEVWRLIADPTSIVRPVADRMPLVTDSVNVPSGLPMATTSWPTLSADESPISMVGRPLASTWRTARSRSGSVGDDRGRQLAAVLERDGDGLGAAGALDDVVVGQDEPVGIEHEAGADAGRRHRERAEARPAGRFGGDGHDRRAGRLGHGHDRVVGGDGRAARSSRRPPGCRGRGAASSRPRSRADPDGHDRGEGRRGHRDAEDTGRARARPRRPGREEVAGCGVGAGRSGGATSGWATRGVRGS